jgi:hypothetical protein
MDGAEESPGSTPLAPWPSLTGLPAGSLRAGLTSNARELVGGSMAASNKRKG